MARRFNRKPPTDAERDARRNADRERIEQAARALLSTDGWQRWIKVRASNGLSRYSLNNQWLIALDCAARDINPTYVAGFRAFLDLNRCVRKGEKAIRILAPVTVKQRDTDGEKTGESKTFFRTVPVFDVSMTDPLPDKEPIPLTPPSQPITGDSHRDLIAPMIAHAAQLGYSVEIRDLPENGPGGWCDPKRKQIVVATGPANRQLRTLVHELAHAHALGVRTRPRTLRGARGLRDLHRLLVGRARRRRRIDPLHRRLGRGRRARRHPPTRRHHRRDRAHPRTRTPARDRDVGDAGRSRSR
jgi:N-terminal domain of anti-restriction factor ArdC